MDHVNGIKAAIAAAAGALTGLWGWFGWLVIGRVACMAMDYITGTAAARKAGAWTSARAREGIWHKAGMIVVVMVSGGADLLVAVVLENVPVVNLPFQYGGTHIAFEICEDGLTDPTYFAAVYREAVELTAYLCKTYGLDPLGDGVVICHQEGYQRGIASNHGDVLHWFPMHGKSMDDFRADVAREMEDNMDEAKIRAIVREEVAAMETERAKLPASDWAKPLLAEAKVLKITENGERPMSMVTREESIAMALAAYKVAIK